MASTIDSLTTPPHPASRLASTLPSAGPSTPRPPATTRVVLDRQLGPFDRMAPDQRMRLIIRVLCGLVAYDSEPDRPDERVAG